MAYLYQDYKELLPHFAKSKSHFHTLPYSLLQIKFACHLQAIIKKYFKITDEMSEEKIKEKYKAMQKVFRNHNFAQQDTEEKIKFTRIWDPLKTKCHEWLARREKKKLEGFLVPLEELVAERSCYRTFADHVKNILLNKFGIKTIS